MSSLNLLLIAVPIVAMLLPYCRIRFRLRVLLPSLLLAAAVWPFLLKQIPTHDFDKPLEQRFPLAWKHIHSFNGTGGAWYIPPEWVDSHGSQPKTIVEAARLASKAATSDQQRQVAHTNIPLLVHQTWKTARIDGWNVEILGWVEKWLDDSITSKRGSPMAYFFWDDEGIMSFMREYEQAFLDSFVLHFSPVERTDIFRILVCKWLGGIYGDVDTEPLQHPSGWVRQSDLAVWTDQTTGKTFGQTETSRSVNVLWGIEADTDPDSDTYWRMGYTYPVQLTQWSLASAPGEHPVFSNFMKNLKTMLQDEKKEAENGTAVKPDPILRTGPAAVTLATKSYLKEHDDLRWNALTGLKDGGKAKLVSDVLILPITGFSPGRGKYGNMGSKSVTDPDARLCHHARGSWRHFDFKVEYGKFCRTVFGMCRDWPRF